MPTQRGGETARGRRGGAPPGSALAVEELHRDAQTLGPEAFEARYGSGFLLVTTAGIGGEASANSTHLLLGDSDEGPGARTADLEVVVYPMRPRHAEAGNLVTIGREANHDVVIPDRSVSRFHAFAKPDPERVPLLHDAGSTNGTTVNGASVPARDVGPPTPLKPGDTVRIGQVEFTFTDARALREFVLQAGG